MNMNQRRRAHVERALKRNADEPLRERAFYEGYRWSKRDLKAMAKRPRPPLVFNTVKPSLALIPGTT